MKKIYFLTLALICAIAANAATNVTIHVRKAGILSSKANLWAWTDNGNIFSSWPGQAFTETETAADGNTYWKMTISVPTSTYSIIFNNGSAQTADITGLSVSETDVWYVVTDNSAYVKIDEPTADSEDPEIPSVTYNVTVPTGTYACYIAGEMTSWSQVEMTKVDATHYTISIEGATTSQVYKYCSGPDWAYVEVNADGSSVDNRSYSENDVVVAWASVYNSGVVEEKGVTYTVTVPEGTETCYIVGAWDWSTFTAMEKVAGEANKFTVYIADAVKSNGYKYTMTASWDNEEVNADESSVSDRTYSENDVVAKWKGIDLVVSYTEIPAGTKFFLKANAWDVDDARFAVYFWDAAGNTAWVDMTLADDEEGIYAAEAPTVGPWIGMIFTRMNPSNTENRWNSEEENSAEEGSDLAANKPLWNQSSDLTWDGTSNLYIINVTDDNWGAGYWSTIDENVVSVAETLADKNVAVEYFNLQGIKVACPENGLFIKKQGSKVTKVIL